MMQEWKEACLVCERAGGIPKYGISWACDLPKCDYKPLITVEELEAMTTSTSDKSINAKGDQ